MFTRPARFALPALLLMGAALCPARADEGPSSSIVTEGDAEASLAPDVAEVVLGVTVDRPTAKAAAADLSSTAAAVRAALAADGVAPADVATAGLELGPVPPPEPEPKRGPAAPQFRATTTLRITVRDIDRVGALLSRMVDNGANTVEGVTFTASGAEARRDGLRADAVRDAKRKADIYAGALGLHLGRVIEVTPTGDGIQPQAMMRMSAAKAVMPVAPGTLSIHTAVSVRWALEP